MKYHRLMLALIVTTAISGCATNGRKTSDTPAAMPGGAVTDTRWRQSDLSGSTVIRDNAGDIPTISCHKTPRTVGGDPGTCTRHAGTNQRTIVVGNVIAKNAVYEDGIVVTEGRNIVYAGCAEGFEADGRETVISCHGATVSPGMVNAHDHITYSNSRPTPRDDEKFAHRNDWRRGLYGHARLKYRKTTHNEVVGLRAIMAGTTSVFGSGADAGPVRVLDAEGINGVKPLYRTFPLGDISVKEYTDAGCGFNYDTSVTNFDTECPYGPHLGEGINAAAHNEMVCLSGGDGGPDIFRSNLAVIHGVAATPDIISKMAERDAKLVWSPRSNISLYGDTAPIVLYRKYGVTIGMGTDWIYSGSANMLRELKCADDLNRDYYDGTFSDRELWEMTTAGSAKALGLDESIGHIAGGYIADIAVYANPNHANVYRSVIDAANKDVELVMVGGRIVYGAKDLVPYGNTVNVCGSFKRYNHEAAGTATINEISRHAGYPVFFCSTPDNEPTCVPSRTREADTTEIGSARYNGGPSDGDRDGDGIPDDVDNCPNIFNPVRPQNADGRQADADGDSIGDVCDPYPLCPNSSEDDCGRNR